MKRRGQADSLSLLKFFFFSLPVWAPPSTSDMHSFLSAPSLYFLLKIIEFL